jgi:hypothetical protein
MSIDQDIMEIFFIEELWEKKNRDKEYWTQHNLITLFSFLKSVHAPIFIKDTFNTLEKTTDKFIECVKIRSGLTHVEDLIVYASNT